jgi:protein-disulfide isomerase
MAARRCNHAVIVSNYHPPSSLAGRIMKFDTQISRLTACVAGMLSLAAPVLGQGQVAATVNKEVITVQELQARTSAKVSTEQAEYELRLRQLKLSHERSRRDYEQGQLGVLIDERVLALEAKAHKTTPDALLKAANAPQITDAQIRSFYDAQRAQINQPFDSIAPQIRTYLQNNAAEAARRQYLDTLRSQYHVSIELQPLRADVASTGPERGPLNAPVTIIEFSDFQCPFCGKFEPAVSHVMAAYPKQVRLVYRNFPLTDLHPDAQKAAEAAQCARDQDKFWEMHDLLFAEQTSLSVDALKEKARRLGLNSKTFDECLDSGKSRDVIAADRHDGDDLGIMGTPASFINGRFTSGAISESELKSLVEDELRRAGRGVTQ